MEFSDPLGNILSERKVLIVEFNESTHHLGTSIELAFRLSRFNDVSYLHMGSYVSSHWLNSGFDKLPKSLLRNRSFSRQLLKTLKAVGCPFSVLTPQIASSLTLERLAYPLMSNLKSIDSSLAIEFMGVFFGKGLLSELITVLATKNPFPLSRKNACIAAQILKSQIQSILSVEAIIDDFDSLVIFNGRSGCEFALKKLASMRKIKYFFYERGGNSSKFFFADFTPHEMQCRWREQQSFFDSLVDLSAVVRKGKAFYDKRLASGDTSWESFTSNQYPSLSARLQHSIDSAQSSNRMVVSFFVSTDYESAMLDGIEPPFLAWNQSQQEALRQLADVCKELDCLLIVRQHPNFKNSSDEDRRSWLVFGEQLRSEFGSIYINSDSRESTYDLVSKSDIVITGFSTVGVESLYLGTPSATLNDAFYSFLCPEIPVLSSPELLRNYLVNMLASSSGSKETEVQKPLSALKYGFWASENGFDFNLFRSQGFHAGFIPGIAFPSRFSFLGLSLLWLKRCFRKSLNLIRI